MTVYAHPKPPKGRLKPSRIVRVNKSDGLEVEICRTPEEWDRRRTEVGTRDGFRCRNRRCRTYAPLHNEPVEYGDGVMPGIIRAGQAAHIDARKMGGGMAVPVMRWIGQRIQEIA